MAYCEICGKGIVVPLDDPTVSLILYCNSCVEVREALIEDATET